MRVNHSQLIHVFPAQAGTQRKTKHADYPPFPEGPVLYPDTGAGTQNPGTKGRGAS